MLSPFMHESSSKSWHITIFLYRSRAACPWLCQLSQSGLSFVDIIPMNHSLSVPHQTRANMLLKMDEDTLLRKSLSTHGL